MLQSMLFCMFYYFEFTLFNTRYVFYTEMFCIIQYNNCSYDHNTTKSILKTYNYQYASCYFQLENLTLEHTLEVLALVHPSCYSQLISGHHPQKNHLQMNAFLEQTLWQIQALHIWNQYKCLQNTNKVQNGLLKRCKSWYMWRSVFFMLCSSSPAEKQRAIVRSVVTDLEMLGLQSTWQILPLHADKQTFK